MNVTLDQHARTKKRYARTNQVPFINKKLSKEIMRSCLRNKFLFTRSDLDWKAYNKPKNYVFSLLRNEKNNFTIIVTLIFWQKIKLSGKLLNPF